MTSRQSGRAGQADHGVFDRALTNDRRGSQSVV
jgi:hypothetical protein